MSCTDSIEAVRGEYFERTITATNTGTAEPEALDTATEITATLRTAEGGGTAVLTSTIGSGVTVLPQSGATLGQATFVFDTSTLTPDTNYWLDVWIDFPGKSYCALRPTLVRFSAGGR